MGWSGIVGTGSVVALANGEASAISSGQAVYCASADTVKLAQANAYPNAVVLGLVAELSINPGETGNVQTHGVIYGLSGLVPGSVEAGGNAKLNTLVKASTAPNYVI